MRTVDIMCYVTMSLYMFLNLLKAERCKNCSCSTIIFETRNKAPDIKVIYVGMYFLHQMVLDKFTLSAIKTYTLKF